MITEQKLPESALLIFLDVYSLKNKNNLDNPYKEFFTLVQSAGLEVIGSIMGKQNLPSTSAFINSGKILEIKSLVKELKPDLVIINHALSASQARNLEKIFKVRVIDKTELILDIFAARASSHIGKLQVELAQLNHLSTRLIRGWTHLERQKGGIGLRGPGETQLETDRRLIGQRIKTLKSKLNKAYKQRQINTYARKKGRSKIVSLVGYTNAGKTSLFNLLTNSDQHAADQLFATLDSVTRKNHDPKLGSILFSDTVGFISDLPTELIASFKATLDELLSADLLLHVIDIADEDYKEKECEVNKILKSIGIKEIPILRVMNKCDMKEIENPSLNNASDICWISVKDQTGIVELRRSIDGILSGGIYEGWISIESRLGKVRSDLYNMGCIKEEKSSSNGTILAFVNIGKDQLNRLLDNEGVSIESNDKIELN